MLKRYEKNLIVLGIVRVRNVQMQGPDSLTRLNTNDCLLRSSFLSWIPYCVQTGVQIGNGEFTPTPLYRE